MEISVTSGMQGHVGFVDGHAAYVPRSYAHSKYHTLPDVEASPWRTFPEIPNATP
jgi:prepilin-type processing-associated H-X9-DG protein